MKSNKLNGNYMSFGLEASHHRFRGFSFQWISPLHFYRTICLSPIILLTAILLAVSPEWCRWAIILNDWNSTYDMCHWSSHVRLKSCIPGTKVEQNMELWDIVKIHAFSVLGIVESKKEITFHSIPIFVHVIFHLSLHEWRSNIVDASL